MGMTTEELTALNRINIYLREERGLSIPDAFRIAKEIMEVLNEIRDTTSRT